MIATTVIALPSGGLAASASSSADISPFIPAAVLDLAPDDVYLGGVELAAGDSTWQLRHWDGRTWSTVAGGAECCGLTAMTSTSPDDIWAVGWRSSGPLIVVHGRSGAWETSTIPGTDFWNPKSMVALSDSNVWVLGSYGHESEVAAVAHFDGTSWTVVDPPVSGSSSGEVSDAAATGPHSMWALGYNEDVGEYLAHGNGHTWKLRTGLQCLNGIGAVSRHDVWVVGACGSAGVGPVTMHWDGTSWTDGRAAPTRDYSWLEDVAGSSATDVWAVGHTGPIQDGARLLIEHWDGLTWAKVPAAHPRQVTIEGFSDVATSGPDDAWAVGFTKSSVTGHLSGGITEHWDGSTWQLVHPGR